MQGRNRMQIAKTGIITQHIYPNLYLSMQPVRTGLCLELENLNL